MEPFVLEQIPHDLMRGDDLFDRVMRGFVQDAKAKRTVNELISIVDRLQWKPDAQVPCVSFDNIRFVGDVVLD